MEEATSVLLAYHVPQVFAHQVPGVRWNRGRHGRQSGTQDHLQKSIVANGGRTPVIKYILVIVKRGLARSEKGESAWA